MVLLSGGLAVAGQPLAQIQPDAGRIQEQLRAPELPRKPAAPQIRIEGPAGEAKVDTPPFSVAGFRVTGATVLRDAGLQRLRGEPNRAMTLAEVQALAERITDRYKRRGYIVARALI